MRATFILVSDHNWLFDLGLWLRDLFSLLRLSRCRHTVTKADVVVGATYNLERLSLLECGHEARLVRLAFLTGSTTTQLVLLVRAPRIKLVIFRENHHVFETAVNPLNSFRKGAFAAGNCHWLVGELNILAYSQLALIVQSPCVDVATSRKRDIEILSHFKIIDLGA